MRLFLYLCTVALSAAQIEVQSVYLLPMAGGLDQYLANRLIAERVFAVVTDPAAAEAVFTDRLGPGFEERMADLFPKPAPESEAKPEGKEEAPGPPSIARGDVAKGGQPAGFMSTFGRGKGTLFLVDVKTRRVLWSVFEPPRGTAARELDRAAGRIAERLKKDLGRK